MMPGLSETTMPRAVRAARGRPWRTRPGRERLVEPAAGRACRPGRRGSRPGPPTSAAPAPGCTGGSPFRSPAALQLLTTQPATTVLRAQKELRAHIILTACTALTSARPLRPEACSRSQDSRHRRRCRTVSTPQMGGVGHGPVDRGGPVLHRWKAFVASLAPYDVHASRRVGAWILALF